MISIPHKTSPCTSNQTLIVGAAFILFTINWQIAMLSIGRVHYFVESVGSGIIFILLLSVLNHFLNFKMAESCFFLHKISKQRQQNKSSLP
jgi:hypothetical protein